MAALRPWITPKPSQSLAVSILQTTYRICKCCIYVCVCADMHTNLTELLSLALANWFSVGLDLLSCSSLLSSPIICHPVGCCSLTCALQMVILWNTARTGVTLPCAKQLSQFATWHFHSNEPVSLGLQACCAVHAQVGFFQTSAHKTLNSCSVRNQYDSF